MRQVGGVKVPANTAHKPPLPLQCLCRVQLVRHQGGPRCDCTEQINNKTSGLRFPSHVICDRGAIADEARVDEALANKALADGVLANGVLARAWHECEVCTNWIGRRHSVPSEVQTMSHACC